MKRQLVVRQLLVFGILSGLILIYTVHDLLGFRVVDKPFDVRIELSDGGGVFDHAEVSFRGVKVGTVTDVRLERDRVIGTLRIDHDAKIPDNSTVVVANLSPVGEQYVNFVPPSKPSETYLRSGALIPATRTRIPPTISSFLYDVEQLLTSVDPNSLRVISREASNAFGGSGPTLKSLITGSQTLLDILDDTQPQTEALLRNADTLLRSARNHTSDLSVFATSLNQLSGTLAKKTPKLEQVVTAANTTLPLINALLQGNTGSLGVLFANAASMSSVQVAYVPAFKALLIALPVTGKYLPRTVIDGLIQAQTNINIDQRLCATGIPMRTPFTFKKEPIHHVNCSGIVRGAMNVPSSGPDRLNGAAPARTVVDSYDPETGLVTGSSGDQVRLGSSGGEQEALGDDSWHAILLAAARYSED